MKIAALVVAIILLAVAAFIAYDKGEVTGLALALAFAGLASFVASFLLPPGP